MFGPKTVRAFVPPPLPPVPSVDLTGFQVLLVQANQSLGRLDGLTAMLSGLDAFLYAYVRKEAVLSSQIEGTQSSLSDLLMFAVDEAPGQLRRGDELRTRPPARGISSLAQADSRDPRRPASNGEGRRQATRRVSHQPERDWLHQALEMRYWFHLRLTW